MPKGPSGRIVIEISPDLKRDLYNVLGSKGLTLKDWFLNNVQEALRNTPQLSLKLDTNKGFNKESTQ